MIYLALLLFRIYLIATLKANKNCLSIMWVSWSSSSFNAADEWCGLFILFGWCCCYRCMHNHTLLALSFWEITPFWLKLLHFQFQYGNPDVLCSPLVDAKTSGKNLVVGFMSLHLLYLLCISGWFPVQFYYNMWELFYLLSTGFRQTDLPRQLILYASSYIWLCYLLFSCIVGIAFHF